MIEALPDSEYSTSDVIDGDGETEESVPICVTVRIHGSEIEGRIHRVEPCAERADQLQPTLQIEPEDLTRPSLQDERASSDQPALQDVPEPLHQQSLLGAREPLNEPHVEDERPLDKSSLQGER